VTGSRLTRRSLLAGSAAFIAACSGKKHPKTSSAPPPDQAAMQTAYREEQKLIGLYKDALKQASPATQAKLEVELAVHETHLSALHAFAVPTTYSPVGGVTDKQLKHTLHAAATSGQQAAVNATEGSNAALLASIAASHTISAVDPE
jgi:hypothetical protein